MADTNETVTLQLSLSSAPQEVDIFVSQLTLSEGGLAVDQESQDITLNHTVSEAPVDIAQEGLAFNQQITDWNPIEIVNTTLSLRSAGDGLVIQAIFHSPICLNSRSKALGPIPPNHPGA